MFLRRYGVQIQSTVLKYALGKVFDSWIRGWIPLVNSYADSNVARTWCDRMSCIFHFCNLPSRFTVDAQPVRVSVKPTWGDCESTATSPLTFSIGQRWGRWASDSLPLDSSPHWFRANPGTLINSPTRHIARDQLLRNGSGFLFCI
jgi:hypothetical protein